MAKVFISYSHDSDLHKRRIRDLALKLRTYQVEVTIDQDQLPGGPDEGWEHWSESQVRVADKVLIACTEPYCARYLGAAPPGIGLGAIAEARLIHHNLYKAAGINPKFRVILFEESDASYVPDTLQTYQHFPLYQPTALTDLITWLTAATPASAGQAPPILWPPPPVVPHIWDMANRRSVTQRLEQILTGRSPKRILLLTAASSSGKTHLLGELKTYAKQLPVPHAAIDCKGGLYLDDLINLIAHDLRKLLLTTHSVTGPDRRIHLIDDLQHLSQPILLSFDTYEQASAPAKHWIETQFLPRLEEAPAVVAVLAGQQTPEHTRQLAALSEQLSLQSISNPSDWLEYAHRKGYASVKPDHMEALTFATNGNPGQLSALLETMLSGLQKSGASAG